MTYRLYPTPVQASRLFHYLQVGRRFYNHALEQRIRCYRDSGTSLTYYTQSADLTQLRAVMPSLADVPREVESDALRRLDKAFANFFRRCKEGADKPGFPRFKSANRWNSFTIGHRVENVVKGGRIRVSGVPGVIRAKNVRNFVGKVKTQCIVFRAGKWSCKLVIDDEQDTPTKALVVSAVGIDMGLTTFATLSDGSKIENPRFLRKTTQKLASAARSVSRKKKGSSNRRKAVRKLQRVYLRLSNQRKFFAHEASRKIVNEHQLIAVEKLNIKGMAQGRLGKSILDASWWLFLFYLSYKAESAGATFVEVDAAGTTQDCSQCGERVPKGLKDRVHACPNCGLTLCRDHNAALNVLRRAIGPQHPAPCRAMGNACGSAMEPKRSRKSETAMQS